jgi:hypothetical protein
MPCLLTTGELKIYLATVAAYAGAPAFVGFLADFDVRDMVLLVRYDGDVCLYVHDVRFVTSHGLKPPLALFVDHKCPFAQKYEYLSLVSAAPFVGPRSLGKVRLHVQERVLHDFDRDRDRDRDLDLGMLFNVTSESVGEVRDRHVVLKLFPTVDLGACVAPPLGVLLGHCRLAAKAVGMDRLWSLSTSSGALLAPDEERSAQSRVLLPRGTVLLMTPG